jgi:alpha-1,6-mannosyltransferase
LGCVEQQRRSKLFYVFGCNRRISILVVVVVVHRDGRGIMPADDDVLTVSPSWPDDTALRLTHAVREPLLLCDPQSRSVVGDSKKAITTSTSNDESVEREREREQGPPFIERISERIEAPSSCRDHSCPAVHLPMTTALRIALAALCCVSLADLVLCPYSKVEESFPLQATHDLYYHGITPALYKTLGMGSSLSESLPYDHLEYPGVVPRSFVAPLVLATLCRLTRTLFYPLVDLDQHPLMVQFLARFYVVLLSLHGWYRLAVALNRRQARVGTYLLWVTASQFHLTFYASRLLPNVLATIVCLHAWAFWVDRRIAAAAVALVATTALLRCDVVLLLLTTGLVWLSQGQLTVGRALQIGITTGVVALGLSIPLDSLLWQRWVWPEGEVFLFNSIRGQSQHWGVSSWHWYLTAALPKALLGSALLIPLAVLRLPEAVVGSPQGGGWYDATWLPYLAAVTAFVGLYSCLGHKEVRFLFPGLPLLNTAAAVGLARLDRVAWPAKTEDQDHTMTTRETRRWLVRISHGAALALLVLSLGASTAFVAVSRHNYPGGVALEYLATLTTYKDDPAAMVVYIDNAAAMTGVSLFGQRALGPAARVVKAGYEASRADDQASWTHVITEDAAWLTDDGFRQVATIPGNPRLDWKRVRLVTTDALYILQRR